MNAEWWVSCPEFTVWVRTSTVSDPQIIIDAAPVVRRFIGQPLPYLIGWMSGLGEVRVKRLISPSPT